MLSVRGSDIAESILSPSYDNSHLTWTYGKHVEHLEKERLILMMENEISGNVPLEALPDKDPGLLTRLLLEENLLHVFNLK